MMLPRRILRCSFILLLASFAIGKPVRRIVVFYDHVKETQKLKLIKEVGGVILKDLPLISAKAALLPPQAERVLRGRAAVKRVDPDVQVFAVKKPDKPGKGKPKPPPEQPSEVLPWGVDRIDAECVWETYTGAGVNVAILDTGIDLDHPDLQANIAGGINIINPRKKPDDDNGHGTHVAGIVAAIDNEIGVIGVAPEATLYAVKVLDRRGTGWTSDVIAGIQWCIDNGIDVVNMSFGASSDVQSLHEAITAAYNAGIVLVAAAGNDSGPVLYPAAYDAEVIAVTATDRADNLADFNNCGPEVDVSAPGVDIFSTWKGGNYAYASGTSMAAPHVTGIAALLIQAGLSPDVLECDQLIDECLGCGIVNACDLVFQTVCECPDQY